jgi:hypothetical protein
MLNTPAQHALYEAPALLDTGETPALQQNAWIGPLIWIVVICYGSAWAFCTAVCGWGHVSSCGTAWWPPHVSVTCR